MSTKNNNEIKVPVFMTKPLDREIELFEINRAEMVDNIIRSIQFFNESKRKIVIENPNKNYVYEIVDVLPERETMGDVPVILLQISAHKTNMGDGYIDLGEKVPVTKEMKIGSDHHFALMYPIIVRGKKRYKSYWDIFVYDDPNKESEELIRIVKTTAKEVLDLKVANLKQKDFVEEIKKYNIIPNVSMSFNSVQMINDEFGASFEGHLVSGKITTRKELNINKLPFDKLNTYLEDDSDITIKRKVFNITIGKKEYKVSKAIKKDIKRASEKYSILIESIFNESIEISDEEKDDIYKPEFIMNKLKSVVANYLS